MLFRSWLLCRYFEKYHDSSTGTLVWNNKLVERIKFVNYVTYQKHFAEDVRETCKRWVSTLLGEWILQGGKGIGRIQKQMRFVEDCIDKCVEEGFLVLMNGGGRDLKMGFQGRNFLKFPTFLNTWLKEYGAILSFFGGGVSFAFVFKWFPILFTRAWLGG